MTPEDPRVSKDLLLARKHLKQAERILKDHQPDTAASLRGYDQATQTKGRLTGLCGADMNSLYQEPEKDGFKHESPIRAFTSFQVDGSYAIGKGFRPSLAHLTSYLAAMAAREGWAIVQILEHTTGSPSMLFRKLDMMERYREAYPAHLLTPDIPHLIPGEKIEPLLNADVIRKIAVGLRQVTRNMDDLAEHKTEQGVDEPHGFTLEAMVQYADRLAGYAAELESELGMTRHTAGFEEAGDRIDQAHKLAETMDLADSDQEDYGDCDDPNCHVADIPGHGHAGTRSIRYSAAPPWNTRGSDTPIPDEHYMDAAVYVIRQMSFPNYVETAIRDFKTRFAPPKNARQISHRSLASQLQFVLGGKETNIVKIKRHIDEFRVAHADRFNNVENFNGEHPIKSTEGTSEHPDTFGENIWSSDITIGGVPISRTFPTDVMDDPVNPKHYDGRECADIGERLSANGYQILKYVWRLGKKDDPCVELGKAIWYGESEMALTVKILKCKTTPNVSGIKPWMVDEFLEERIADQPQFTQNIARMLWRGYNQRRLKAIIEAIQEHKVHMECGRGLAV